MGLNRMLLLKLKLLSVKLLHVFPDSQRVAQGRDYRRVCLLSNLPVQARIGGLQLSIHVRDHLPHLRLQIDLAVITLVHGLACAHFRNKVLPDVVIQTLR